MSHNQIDILKQALIRETEARKRAEKNLEEKAIRSVEDEQKVKKVNKKIEALLDEGAIQLLEIFESINDAYLIMDLTGNVLKMNKIAVDLFGYNIDEEELNVVSLIFKEDYLYAMGAYSELVEKGYFSNYKARIVTKEGVIKWVHINANIIYDNQKKPVAAQGIIRDITVEKKSNEIIKEQINQLDVIVDNSSFGIVLTQHGQILKSNKAIQQILGYTKEELTKLTIKDISFIEDFPQSMDYLNKMDSGVIDSFVIEKRYKKRDGSILWCKTNVNAVRDENRNIKYQVALIEDITSQREKTLIIEMINDIAKSILGKLDIHEIAWEIANKIAVFLGTEDCVIYLVDSKNKTLEQIAAYGDKISNENQILNKVMIPIGKGIVGTVAKTGEAELVKDTSKDERYIVDDKIRLSEIAVPIISEGNIIGVIDSEYSNKNYYTIEHLHALKNIASLVAMQLKSAINLRERQKAEIKNIQLLKELEKSNDELQEYAHIVSHDLKSPLRSIDALVNWIKEDNKGKLDKESLLNFGYIETTLVKMEQLISDILNYSSIRTESIPKESINLNIVIEEIKEILYIPDHISIKVLSKLPMIKGERIKIQQLFQNLIGNAVKFINKENGVIEINVVEKASFYQFSIRDNGIGIEKKHHNRIFKIFHSLNDTKESTGIGLAIVKKIIDVYHGEIWLESKVNEGTIFYFTLKKD